MVRSKTIEQVACDELIARLDSGRPVVREPQISLRGEQGRTFQFIPSVYWLCLWLLQFARPGPSSDPRPRRAAGEAERRRAAPLSGQRMRQLPSGVELVIECL
jgi:hypothetical protein